MSDRKTEAKIHIAGLIGAGIGFGAGALLIAAMAGLMC